MTNALPLSPLTTMTAMDWAGSYARFTARAVLEGDADGVTYWSNLYGEADRSVIVRFSPAN